VKKGLGLDLKASAPLRRREIYVVPENKKYIYLLGGKGGV